MADDDTALPLDDIAPETAAPAPSPRKRGRPAKDTIRRGGTLRAPIRGEPIRDPVRPFDQGYAAGEVPQGLRRRERRGDEKFYIDPKIIPDKVSYEWKRVSCYGQPDHSHQIEVRENHWRPVPAERHPHLMPSNVTSGSIERDGLILMERPLYLTEDARREDFAKAVGPIDRLQNEYSKTPAGTMTRDHPSVRRNTKINKSIEPGTIPE